MEKALSDSILNLPYQMGYARQDLVTMVYDNDRLERLVSKLTEMYGKEAVLKTFNKVLGAK